MHGSLSPAGGFASSLLIPLREGLEKILVPAAIVGFVELPLLGIHARAQGLAWQGLTRALIVAAYLLRRQQAPRPG